jgi:predicted NBD/HSP70 family sugar kinase
MRVSPLLSRPQNQAFSQRQGTLAFDVGGTTITSAYYHGEDELPQNRQSVKTPKHTDSKQTASMTLDILTEQAAAYLKTLSPDQLSKEGAIGIAAPGVVTPEGSLKNSGNLEFPPDYPLAAQLQARLKALGFHVPVVVMNDGKAPANAIVQFKQPALAIVGTGVNIAPDAKVKSAEGGHAHLYGLKNHTVEDQISGRALARIAQEEAKKRGLKTFVGIKVEDLYNESPDSSLYDKTMRRIGANHAPFEKNMTYLKVSDQDRVPNLSKAEKEILQHLDDHLHDKLGQALAIARLGNVDMDGIILAGSVADMLNLEKLRSSTNAYIGKKQKAALGIKDISFFAKVNEHAALKGAAQVARDALQSSGKSVTQEAKGFAWGTALVSLVLGGALGYLAKAMMKPSPSPTPAKPTSDLSAMTPAENSQNVIDTEVKKEEIPAPKPTEKH